MSSSPIDGIYVSAEDVIPIEAIVIKGKDFTHTKLDATVVNVPSVREMTDAEFHQLTVTSQVKIDIRRYFKTDNGWEVYLNDKSRFVITRMFQGRRLAAQGKGVWFDARRSAFKTWMLDGILPDDFVYWAVLAAAIFILFSYYITHGNPDNWPL